jgi:hypothetical protein
MSRLRGCNAVLIVVLPEGFVPRSVWDIPPMFSKGEVYARRLPLYMAQGFAWTYNKHQLAEQIPDRKWAIAVNAKLDARNLGEHARVDREQLAGFAPVNDGPAPIHEPRAGGAR